MEQNYLTETPDNQLLISYYHKLLEPSALKMIDKKIEDSDVWRNAFDGICEIIESFGVDDPTDLIAEVISEANNTQETKSETKIKSLKVNNRFTALMVAASAAALLAFGYFGFFSSSESKLVAEVRSEYFDEVENTRGGGEKWQTDFNEGDWSAVIKELSSNQRIVTATESFYLGAAQFKQGNDREAVESLKIAVKSEYWKSDAYLLLGCAFINLEEKQAAIENLKKSDSKMAKELLETLK